MQIKHFCIHLQIHNILAYFIADNYLNWKPNILVHEFKKVSVKTNLECRLGYPGPQGVNKSSFYLLSSPKVIWHISKAKPL